MASAMQILPARSISLPTRLHPNSNRIETELENLKGSEFSSASSIRIGLTQLAELYNCVEEIIQYPVTQAALHHNKPTVEEALDRSISLIDACCSVRDLILSMKEQIQDLQSAFRRIGKNSRIETNINSYISFRKKFKKDISRNLKSLKKLETNYNPNPSAVSPEFLVDRILGESRLITITIFESLLVYLSTSDSRTSNSKWSLISKLMKGPSEKIITAEIGAIDLDLYSLQEKIRRKDKAKADDIQLVQRRLEKISFSLKKFEDGFDSLFRGLIQNRVALLNILTP